MVSGAFWHKSSLQREGRGTRTSWNKYLSSLGSSPWSFNHMMVGIKVWSCFTLHSKDTLLPLCTTACSGCLMILVGSKIQSFDYPFWQSWRICSVSYNTWKCSSTLSYLWFPSELRSLPSLICFLPHKYTSPYYPFGPQEFLMFHYHVRHKCLREGRFLWFL